MTIEHHDSNSSRVGCAWSIFGVNGLIMGLAALSFAQGPYSSMEQEFWYRYGSLGLLLAGVIVPGALLLSGARRRGWAIAMISIWMVAVFAAFLIYAFYAGGGV